MGMMRVVFTSTIFSVLAFCEVFPAAQMRAQEQQIGHRYARVPVHRALNDEELRDRGYEPGPGWDEAMVDLDRLQRDGIALDRVVVLQDRNNPRLLMMALRPPHPDYARGHAGPPPGPNDNGNVLPPLPPAGPDGDGNVVPSAGPNYILIGGVVVLAALIADLAFRKKQSLLYRAYAYLVGEDEKEIYEEPLGDKNQSVHGTLA